MDTQEIPRDQWEQFFNRFNRDHEAWRTSVELMGRDVGDQCAVDDMPLQGIDFEKVGSDAGDILIGLGMEPNQFMTHVISSPSSIRVAEQPGVEVDIEIDSKAGPSTLLRLRPARELLH